MSGFGRGGRGMRGRKRKLEDDGWGGHGGYMNAKIEKLAKQGSPQKKLSDIFKGVSIFINGYTKPPQDELRKMLLENGGEYQHYYRRSKVTHIIASNLPQSKITQLRNEKIVKPEWITESLLAKRLLPYQSYLLYNQKAFGINTSLLTSMRSDENDLTNSVTFDDCHSISGESKLENLETEQILLFDGILEEGQNDDDFLFHQNSSDVENNESSSADGKGLADSLVPGKSTVTTNFCSEIEVEVKQNASIALKSGDPGFISEFYNHSRLHHLSTWGAEFKSYVTSLQQQAHAGFPGRDRLRHFITQRLHQGSNSEEQCVKELGSVGGCRQRVIMHIDMDCFFVSVALRNRKELKGYPVAVTHSKGKGPVGNEKIMAIEKAYWSGGQNTASTCEGKQDQNAAQSSETTATLPNKDISIYYSMAEIASCSYEARQAGVRNGMLFGKAKKLCPELIPVPYDFDGYREVSQQLYDAIGSYTLEIEAVSCDELYVDCGDVIADTGASPLEFASLLRQEIFEKTNCTASAGLGGNMLLARLATKVAKPNGQVLVDADMVSDFMKARLVSELPGIGHVMSDKLQALDVRTCGDLLKVSVPTLQKNFGQKTGQMLYHYARGEDNRALKTSVERKSVSAEINYGIRFVQMSEVEKFLGELSSEVQSRLKKINKKGRTVTLKLKVRQDGAPKTTAKFMGHGICDNICKSSTLPVATENADVIAQECCALLRHIKVDAEDLRGVGIQMTFLEATSGQANNVSGCRSILDFAAPKVVCSESNQNNAKSAGQNLTTVGLWSGSEGLTANTNKSSSSLNSSTVNVFTSKKSLNADSLPPLPSLGSLNLSFEESEGTSGVRSTVQSSSTNITYLPTQIDESILNELPEDIQKEIKEALKKQMPEPLGSTSIIAKEDQKKSGCKTKAAEDDIRPGCSHWTSDGANNYTTTKFSDLNALPPYSQLDPSCLDALPPELQEEIELAYASDHEKKNLEVPENDEKFLHPLMREDVRNSSKLSPLKTSPGKKNSPKKSPGKKTSPSFKVPTGKPPGKRKNSLRKQLLFSAKPSSRESLKSVPTSANLFKEESIYVPPATGKQFICKTNSPHSDDVRLTSAVCLDSLRQLFRSWIQSSVSPSEDDLKTYFHYFMQLIQGNDLERVDILLKFVNRISHGETMSSEWKKGSQWIIDQVQSVVRSLYGGPIKLPEH